MYKKMKYNTADHFDNEQVSKKNIVDPVNSYIMNKNYTHKTRMSKLDKMKRIVQLKRNEERIKKIIQEEQEKKIQNSKSLEVELVNGETKADELKEEILEENIIKIDDDVDHDINKDENSKQIKVDSLLKENDDKDDDNEDDDEEEDSDYIEDGEECELEEDEENENEYWDSLLNGGEDDFNYSSEDGEEIEEGEEDEKELDPRFLCFLADSGEETLDDISEEDKKIIEAYRNCQKNTQILKSIKNKNKKSKNKNKPDLKVSNSLNHNKKNIISSPSMKDEYKSLSKNGNSQENKNFKNILQISGNSTPIKSKKNLKTSEEVISLNSSTNNLQNKILSNTIVSNFTPARKRKNSVNSQNSNKLSSIKKKNVVFKISSNQFNGILILNKNLEYDRLKPIMLNSKRSNGEETVKPLKGNLRKIRK